MKGIHSIASSSTRHEKASESSVSKRQALWNELLVMHRSIPMYKFFVSTAKREKEMMANRKRQRKGKESNKFFFFFVFFLLRLNNMFISGRASCACALAIRVSMKRWWGAAMLPKVCRIRARTRLNEKWETERECVHTRVRTNESDTASTVDQAERSLVVFVSLNKKEDEEEGEGEGEEGEGKEHAPRRTIQRRQSFLVHRCLTDWYSFSGWTRRKAVDWFVQLSMKNYWKIRKNNPQIMRYILSREIRWWWQWSSSSSSSSSAAFSM